MDGYHELRFQGGLSHTKRVINRLSKRERQGGTHNVVIQRSTFFNEG